MAQRFLSLDEAAQQLGVAKDKLTASARDEALVDHPAAGEAEPAVEHGQPAGRTRKLEGQRVEAEVPLDLEPGLARRLREGSVPRPVFEARVRPDAEPVREAHRPVPRPV